MYWLVLLILAAGVVALVAFFLLVLYVVSPMVGPKRMSLSGAHVVITGGSSGIGKGVAIECFKQGAFITLLARNENRLLEAKSEIEQYSVNDKQVVHVVPVDVSKDCANVAKVIKQAQEKLGPVDMLVNCAGTSVNGKFEELDTSKFEELMAVNYLGTVYPTRAVVPTMKERRIGRIVFVSSQAGQIGVFGYSAYSATKFALRGLAEALQMEVKPYNIYVTVAYPPDTDTPGYAEESKSKLLETQLISESSTVCQPDHVARIIVRDAIQGKAHSSIGPDGRLLAILTAGVSPVTSIAEALEAVMCIGVCRLVSLYYTTSFDSIVHRCMLQKEKSQKAD